jgi:hypothetical protein
MVDGSAAVSWIYLYGGDLTGKRVERWAAGIAVSSGTWRG